MMSFLCILPLPVSKLVFGKERKNLGLVKNFYEQNRYNKWEIVLAIVYQYFDVFCENLTTEVFLQNP